MEFHNSDLQVAASTEENDEKTGKSNHVSVTLIAKRNLPATVTSGSSEEFVHHLLKLTHVRLDRENIAEIDNLEVLGPVTNLYLQQNLIKRIENLECLDNLRFLTLAGNQIRTIENLLVIPKLQFLDLSQNMIQDLNVGELPKSLVILDLRGNPCCAAEDYRSKISDALPGLKQLDGEALSSCSDEEDEELDVHDKDEEDEELDVHDKDEEDEEPDVHAKDESYHTALDEVLQMSADLIKKSHQRLEGYTKLHESHMVQIEEQRAQSRQAMASEGTPRTSRGKTPER